MSELGELYCADGHVERDNEGLIYKTVLRTGTWRYRPGAGQKPIAKPLKVVAGHSDSDDTIGMADVVNAFKDGAVEHVTIPLSHDDRVHENTGYIRSLQIEPDPDRQGESILKAGFEFTEPDIEQKVLNGSIANTSVGLFYDYVRKEDGKKFPIALGHVALTNHPWINGMKPFNTIAASEDLETKGYEFDATPADGGDVDPDPTTATIAWDTEDGYNNRCDEVREALAALTPGSTESPYFIIDLMDDKVLVGSYDDSEDNWVIPYTIGASVQATDPDDNDDDEVILAPADKWIPAKKEWIAAYSDVIAEKRLSEEKAPQSNNTTGGNHMPDVHGLEGLDLSDDVAEKVAALLQAKDEELETARATATALSEKERERTVEDRIEELKAEGFSQAPAFLAKVRQYLLADTGTKALTLSEDSGSTDVSVTEIVEGLLETLPKKDGKVNFGDQIESLGLTDERPPATTEDENKTGEDKFAEAHEFLYGSKPDSK